MSIIATSFLKLYSLFNSIHLRTIQFLSVRVKNIILQPAIKLALIVLRVKVAYIQDFGINQLN